MRCAATIRLPLPVTSVWGQLRDFQRFATQDHFHAHVTIDGGIPREGAAIVMEHRYLGVRIDRIGRILRWRENDGFVFSDLSTRGKTKAFPHVLSFRLFPRDSKHCELRIQVTGKWTTPLPRWAARVWLRWVFRQVVRSTNNQFLEFAIFRKRHALHVAL